MYAALVNEKLVTAYEEYSLLPNYQQLNTKIYRCPRCKKRVILIVSQSKAPFFKHYNVSQGKGEKEEHALSKQMLCTALVGAGYQAKMEVNLAYRQLRADILMQNSISFEIQCSPISDIEFDHRHNLYEKIGIKDVWVVGLRHFLHQQLRESQKKFLRFNQQWGWYYLEINPYEADISLKYNILLSPISRKLKYQIKKFSLDDLGIRKFFNFVPYLKRYSLPDVQFQRQYLHKKIQQKTGYGLQVAQLLYENRKSVEDIPVEILTQYYLPKQNCPLVQYLQKISEDTETK